MKSRQLQVLLAVVAALFVAGLNPGARAQLGPNANPSKLGSVLPASLQVPDYVVYRTFFSHVAEREQMAAQLESQGNNAEDFRAHDWKAAGLTADEGASMKQVALDCIQALSDLSQHMQADRAAQGASPSNPASASRSLSGSSQPYEHRSEIVNDHINQLKQMLGDTSFAKLDKYVRTLQAASGANTLAPLPIPLEEPDPHVPVNPNIHPKPGLTSTAGVQGAQQ
jgi:hypothetical protein